MLWLHATWCNGLMLVTNHGSGQGELLLQTGFVPRSQCNTVSTGHPIVVYDSKILNTDNSCVLYPFCSTWTFLVAWNTSPIQCLRLFVNVLNLLSYFGYTTGWQRRRSTFDNSRTYVTFDKVRKLRSSMAVHQFDVDVIEPYIDLVMRRCNQYSNQ